MRDLQTGTTTLLSAKSNDADSGNGYSDGAAISNDGRYASFFSNATNLVSGVTPSDYNLYVRDLQTQTTKIVNLDANGNLLPYLGFRPTIIRVAANGHHVVFFTAGPYDNSQVYARDLESNTLSLLSADPNGNPANASAGADYYAVQASADGRWVAFASTASNLVAGDTNNRNDLFLRDLLNGTTTLVSAQPNGAPGNGDVQAFTLSDDGQHVAFTSYATDLISGQTTSGLQLFFRDLVTNTTRLISAGSNGQPVALSVSQMRLSTHGEIVSFDFNGTNLIDHDNNGTTDVAAWSSSTGGLQAVSRRVDGPPSATPAAASNLKSMTPDGQKIVFFSKAPDILPTEVNSQYKVLVKDLASGDITLVSNNYSNTGASSGNAFQAAISPDGKYVAFASTGPDLVPNLYIPYKPELYVRDLEQQTTTLVTLGLDGQAGDTNTFNYEPTWSPDGKKLFFVTNSKNLVANGNLSNAQQVYQYQLSTHQITLVSANASGAPANYSSDLPGYSGIRGNSVAAVSGDGRYVIFSSYASDLVPSLTSAGGQRSNLFMHDTVTGETRLISVSQDGTMDGNSSTFPYYASISADGHYIVFDSFASNLVTGDDNTSSDVFVRDIVNNATSLISVAAQGSHAGHGFSYEPTMSTDGHYIGFTSTADDLLAGQTVSESNIYLRDRVSGTMTLVSVKNDGSAGRYSNYPIITPDGRQIAFISGDDITGDSGAIGNNMYIRDLGSLTTKLASPHGLDANNYYSGSYPNSFFLSSDGSSLVFEVNSGADLIAGDYNNTSDIILFQKFLSNTVHWAGAGSGDWNDASNWSNGQVPGTNDRVIIDTAGITVTHASGATMVKSLDSKASLSITGGTLSVTGTFSMASGASLAATGVGTMFDAAGASTIDGVSLLVTNGATITLPGVTSFIADSETWRADGTDSILRLANLASTSHSKNTTWEIDGSNAGLVDLPALTSMNDATATGTGLVKVDGGTVKLPVLQLSQHDTFDVRNGGTLQTPALATVNYGTLKLLSSGFDFSNISNFDYTSAFVSNGLTLALPGVTTLAVGSQTWEVSGTGSVLRLAQLTKIMHTSGTDWNTHALSSGLVDLPALTSMKSDLTTSAGHVKADGGTVKLTALQLTQHVNLDVLNGGVIQTPALATFNYGTVTFASAGFDLTSITNFDYSNAFISNGVMLSLPNVTAFVADSLTNSDAATTEAWEVSGANSIMRLAHLTQITQPGGGYWHVKALSGGLVDLLAVSSISRSPGTGQDYMEANAGSIRMPVLVSDDSIRLTATGTGAITLNPSQTRIISAIAEVLSSGQIIGSLSIEGNGVLQGSGTIQGPVVSFAKVSPGGTSTVGALRITGNYYQSSAGNLAVDLAGPTAGSQYDQLVVQGNVFLAGVVSATLLNGYAPNLGDSYTILSASAVSGAFESSSGLQLGGGLALDPVFNSTNVALVAQPAKGPKITTSTPTGALQTGQDHIDVTFSKVITLSSFTTSEIKLTGPSGAITVNAPIRLTNLIFRIPFALQKDAGTYSISIGPDIMDLAGNKMDQNGDGVNGTSNDVYTSSFALALPDLAASNVSAPAAGLDGTAINVSWQVTNQSANVAAQFLWKDAVYVSTKTTLDNTAVLAARFDAPHTPPLNPGASYTRNVSLTIPKTAPTGNVYLLVVANDDDGQLEVDYASKSNNVSARAITLSAADLSITGLSGPASGFTNQNVLVGWTDRNDGTAAVASPWTDYVYAASDSQGHNPIYLGSFTFTQGLAIGAQQSHTQQVMLPNTAGTYFLEVVANGDGAIAEGTHFDNNTTISSSSINVQQAPVPNLFVTSITPPPNGVLSGNTVDVSFVVTNQGNAPTSAPVWNDWIILSKDADLASAYNGMADAILLNQPVIGSAENPSFLDPSKSYSQTIHLPLPIDAQGTWYAYVVPDGTGDHHPPTMPENSRVGKLARSAGFSVTLSTPPDLVTTNVTAPDTSFSGQSVRVSWTVKDDSSSPTNASTWTDAVYLSTTASLGTDSIELGEFVHRGKLTGTAQYTDSELVTIPVNIGGSYFFLVKTDVNGAVFENGITGNNLKATATAKTINLTPPPDLKVNPFSTATTAIAGHTLTFAYTVANAGAGATPNFTWNDTIYLSPTQTFDSSTAIPLSEPTIQGGLKASGDPSDHYSKNLTVTLPNDKSGNYYLIVKTDSENVVFEVDKTNNTRTASNAILISSKPADLVVTANPPATGTAGSAILMNWTVTNQGLGDTTSDTWVDKVYVGTGSTLDNQAVLLGTFVHNGILAAGSSYTQSKLVDLPIALRGAYKVFIVVNAGDNNTPQIYESNLDNNVSPPAPIAVDQQLADLKISSVSVADPVYIGFAVTVNWTVQNAGTAITDAGYWYDDIWLSTNTTIGSGGADLHLGALQHTNPLDTGGQYSASQNYTLPRDLTPGTYYFVVITDFSQVNKFNNRVYESDETNNSKATSAHNIALAPTADLAVTQVSAPTAVTSGSPFQLSWSVKNTGIDTGNVGITDSVYLSFDQVFDGSDRYLDSFVKTGGLANSASYTQTVNVNLPSGVAGTFYVFVVTNSTKSLDEQNRSNNPGYATTPLVITLPPPADLVAGTITIPPEGTAGRAIDITYQVTNQGGNPAAGTWYDSLYLSPTNTWTINSPLLGRVQQTQNIAANGGSYTSTVTTTLPGIAPGLYYVILRTNIRNNLRESTQDNNLSASVTRSSLDAPQLTIFLPEQGTLHQDESAFYKVVVTAQQTLQISVSTPTGLAFNELYVSYGTMPTRSKYDFRYATPFQPNQQITIPSTQAGSYYVLAYASSLPDPSENYTLTASTIPFSVQGVTPGQVGAGRVSLQFQGAKFAPDTTFQLQMGTGTLLAATQVIWRDAATAFATFDLTGQPLGLYDAQAKQSDGTTTRLAQAVQVVAATANNQVQAQLSVPQVELAGRTSQVTISYFNPGNTDLPLPLFLLNGENALFQAPGHTQFTNAALQLVGLDPNGVLPVLAPGAQGNITLRYKPITSAAGDLSTFTLQMLRDPSELFNWQALAAQNVPLNTASTQWTAIVDAARQMIGTTWGDVLGFLNQHSAELLNKASTDASVTGSAGLYNFNELLQYVVGFYGSASAVLKTPTFSTVASDSEVTIYNAHTDNAGNPVAPNPNWPTYVLIPGLNGYRDAFGPLAAAIAGDATDFPSGQVNVLVATWKGATSGTTINGSSLPWVAAERINNAGDHLGDLLNQLVSSGLINTSTVAVVGEGSGNYVGNRAAQRLGGLAGAIALNADSGLAGYAPVDLTRSFRHSISYDTTSLFDTQSAIAESNQTLPIGDINDPVAQHTLGITWLTQQILQGNTANLKPTTPVVPDQLPAINNPSPASAPAGIDLGLGIVQQIIPVDPNDIIGPKGTGVNGIVAEDQPMPYQIHFANLPSAGAPAQKVTVTSKLDDDLDFRTFRLAGVDFGTTDQSVPDNSAFFQTRVDLTSTKGYYVDVAATVNILTGIATWTLTTVTPSTGETPLDPRVGFLPPNDTAGTGEGSVFFTVRPKTNLATGAVINASATITFDNQPPLATRTISNQIDAGTGLQSSMKLLPVYQTASPFTVSWSGSTASQGSAVRSFAIYVSDNGLAYTPWLVDTTLTSAPFQGQDGHHYDFYSQATDNVGNVEQASVSAQASTLVDLTAPVSSVTALPSKSPLAGFTVRWSGQDAASGIASYDVYAQDNGGAFTRWLSATTNTSSTYTGQAGHTYGFYTVALDNAGNRQATPASAQTTTMVLAPPTTSAPKVNDGTVQRSLLQKLTVSFDHTVTLDTGAFTIALHAGVTINNVAGQTVGTLPVLNWTTSDGGLSYVLTFSGTGVVNGSIADGVYDVKLDRNKVHDAANQIMATDLLFTFFRLFGDFNGDGTVNNADNGQFSRAFNKNIGQTGYLALFDYNGDGAINNFDNAQFSRRFNTIYRF